MLSAFLFLCGIEPTAAVETNGNFNNNADPGSGLPDWSMGWPSPGSDGWNYVGQVNGASGTYLGNGWVITAAHVGAGDFTLGSTTYSMINGSATSLTGFNPDLVLFRIALPPTLPALPISALPPVPFSSGEGGSEIAMVGYGGGKTWGLNTVTGINDALSPNGRPTIEFSTTNGTTTLGGNSVTNSSDLVVGDSGGGDFIYNAAKSRWELAGINDETGTSSFFVQLSSYAQQIIDIVGLDQAPVITTQPSSASILAGTAISFSAAATGSEPMSFQWTKNGTAISGATGATYTLPAPVVSDSDDYSVTVANSEGSALSSTATLTVAPLTISPLSDQVAVIGQSASFSSTLTGSGPFSYQWLRDGAAISGANQSSFTLSSVSSGDAGAYSLVATNSFGSATSNVAQLVVVVSQQQVTLGQAASFAAIPSGSGPFTYQWEFNGAAISGAVNSSFTLSAATGDDGGIYSVVIDGPGGDVTENYALVVDSSAASTPAMPAWALAVMAMLFVVAADRRLRFA